MINFEPDYQNALSDKRASTTNTPQETYSDFPDYSELSKKHLFYINYIGTNIVQYPYSIKMQSLDSFLLLFTYNGQGKIQYNNKKYLLYSNTILFIHCLQGFKLDIYESSSWSYKWIYFNGNISSQLYDIFTGDNNHLFECKPLSDIDMLFTKILNNCQNGMVNELLLSMLLYNLITTLILEKQSQNNGTPKIPPYILKMKELFDNNYNDSYNLQLLSIMFKVNKYTLSREFSKYIHMSPIEYLINKRISAAKELLWTTTISVNEISQKVGIDNPTHFINLFKKRVGITPLQYRNQHYQPNR